jgi:hypothetical protein
MPSVHAPIPKPIRDKLKKKFDDVFDEEVTLDPTRIVTIKGWVGTQLKEVMVAGPLCLVVLTKKQAKELELTDRNSDWDLCIWDPVTGTIRCTQDE